MSNPVMYGHRSSQDYDPDDRGREQQAAIERWLNTLPEEQRAKYARLSA